MFKTAYRTEIAVAPANEPPEALRLWEAARCLSHPGIQTVFETKREEGQLILVLEHVPGPSLDTVLRAAGGPLPP